MTLAELQERIRDLFGAKDARRGVEGTFMWFMEEVGELSAALRERKDRDNLVLEFADVLAWLATLANIAGVELEEAMARKYGSGCPKCLTGSTLHGTVDHGQNRDGCTYTLSVRDNENSMPVPALPGERGGAKIYSPSPPGRGGWGVRAGRRASVPTLGRGSCRFDVVFSQHL